MIQDAIERNRKREARFNKAERMLRRVRLSMYDRDEANYDVRAGRLIDRIKARLRPRWEQQDRNREVRRSHWMYACE